ncbi:MAG: hypothetical protein ACJAUV_001639 [Flavobacteriales bacterium]|jgi:hypothetical protein
MNTSDWGSFGGYISPVLSLLTMIIMIYEIRNRDNRKKVVDKFEHLYSELLLISKTYDNWHNAIINNPEKSDGFRNDIKRSFIHINLLIKLHFNNQIGGIVYPYYRMIDYLLLKKPLSLDKYKLITEFFFNEVIKKLDLSNELNQISSVKNKDDFSLKSKEGYDFIAEKLKIDFNSI